MVIVVMRLLLTYMNSYCRAFLSKYSKLFETEIIEIKESKTNLEIPISTSTNKLFKVVDPNNSNDYWWIEYRARGGTSDTETL